MGRKMGGSGEGVLWEEEFSQVVFEGWGDQASEKK